MNTPTSNPYLNEKEQQYITDTLNKIFLDRNGAVALAIWYAWYHQIIPRHTHIRQHSFRSIAEFNDFLIFVDACVKKKWILRWHLIENITLVPHLSLTPEVNHGAEIFIDGIIAQWHGGILYALAMSWIFDISTLGAKITNLSFDSRAQVEMFQSLVMWLIKDGDRIQQEVINKLPTQWDLIETIAASASSTAQIADTVSELIEKSPDFLNLKIYWMVQTFISFEDYGKNQPLEEVIEAIMKWAKLSDIQQVTFKSHIPKLRSLIPLKVQKMDDDLKRLKQERDAFVAEQDIIQADGKNKVLTGIIEEAKATQGRIEEINTFLLSVFKIHPELEALVWKLHIPFRLPHIISQVV